MSTPYPQLPTPFDLTPLEPVDPADSPPLEAIDSVTFAGLSEVLSPYLPVFFVAFMGALIATPIMRRLAISHEIVDRPNAKRKIHEEPIAYLGGVAIFIGWLLAIGLVYFLHPHDDPNDRIAFPFSIVIGAVAILLTGLFDDVMEISPRVKIGGQLFAAAALASDDVGTQLVSQSFETIQQVAIKPLGIGGAFGDMLMTAPHPMLVYILGTAAIAVFVIGACNALNLIDGMDGLAAGTSAISAAGFLMIALILAIHTANDVDPIRIVMALALLGALLGFLPYNFNPANIFMGDAGSLLVGYLACATMLLFSYNSEGGALKYVTACLIVFAFPITDTSLAIFRRKMAGKPLMSPDAQHIHHLLKRSGMSVRRCVLVMYGVAMLFAVIGVAMIAWQFRFRTLLAVAMVLYGFIFVTAYKYGKLQANASRRAAEAPGAGTPADPSAPTPNGAATHPAQTARNLVEPGRPETPAAPADPR